MGRNRLEKEARNWALTVSLTRSVGLALDAIAKKLGWSRASVISGLILEFGEALVKKSTVEDDCTELNDKLDEAGVRPPVNIDKEEM